MINTDFEVIKRPNITAAGTDTSLGSAVLKVSELMPLIVIPLSPKQVRKTTSQTRNGTLFMFSQLANSVPIKPSALVSPISSPMPSKLNPNNMLTSSSTAIKAMAVRAMLNQRFEGDKRRSVMYIIRDRVGFLYHSLKYIPVIKSNRM